VAEERTWQVWTVERSISRETGEARPLIRIEKLDVSGVETKPLDDELKAIARAGDYVEVTVPEGRRGLRYVDGQLDVELPAGRHAAFSVVKKVTFATIDLRERVLRGDGPGGHDEGPRDAALNVSATFKVSDAKRLATGRARADEVLYLAVQLSAREAVHRAHARRAARFARRALGAAGRGGARSGPRRSVLDAHRPGP